MDAFSNKPKIKHTCIKDGCDYFYIADERIHMICKLHSPERPVMRRDGKKEKDLKAEFANSNALSLEHQKELMNLIYSCFMKIIPVQDYYRELSDFWKKVGEPEFADEIEFYEKAKG